MGDTILALDPFMKEYCGYVEAMVSEHIYFLHVLLLGPGGLIHRCTGFLGWGRDLLVWVQFLGR